MKNFGTGYQGFGNPLPMDIDLDGDDLTLAADGFASGDKILNWSGSWSTYTYNGTTYGLDLLAGKSYIFRVASAFTWDYTVAAAPAAAIEVPTVQKVRANNAAALR
jgi:hypothetical protein